TEAKRLMTRNHWRGNVRELENAMHRAVLLATGAEIDADALRTPEGDALCSAPADPAARAARTAEAVTRALVGRTVAEVERELILETLDHCLGTAPTRPRSWASRSGPCATN
ncbi:MAG: Flagellar system sigma 54-dependent response regulator FlbD, partial [uncultured Microvirga sp.]